MSRRCRLRNALHLLLLWPLTAPAFFHASPNDPLPDEPLPVEEAFRAEVVASDDGIRLEWRIEEGYYLYRDKLSFASETTGIELGSPTLPPGETREDAYFGSQVVYRNRATIDIPLRRAPGSPDTLTLAIGSQGCADMGICYPPRIQRFDVALPTLPSQSTAAAGADSDDTSKIQDLLALLGGAGVLGGSDDPFLPVEKAFAFDAVAEGPERIVARWRIADGYYLYRDKFTFELDGGEVALDAPRFPPGEEKDDPYFGQLEVYHGDLAVTLPLLRSTDGARTVQLTAGYQGCAEDGICYPPTTTTTRLLLPPLVTALPRAASATTAPTLATEPVATLSAQDGIARTLANGSMLLTVASFFGFGLLLAFTPCVFPMIPILSGIIVGQGHTITTRRAFALSLAYVLAMAATYTVAGVLAGLFGGNLQATFQEPWILASFSAVFVLLALSMFGFYELQLPTWLQSRMATLSNRQHRGTLTGAAAMGGLSALIVGPCVAAPLAGALIYIGQTGDALLGGIALFALSMGMGAPLLLIGTSAGKLLPHAGAWMDAVKAVFGVLLLAVAIYLLERIIPGPVALLLWALLLIVSAIYLGALQSLPSPASGWRRLWKGLGVVLLIYGVLLMVGAALGNSDPFRPLHGLRGGGAAAVAEGLVFKPVKSLADTEREIAAASAQGRSVMLDFYADWCVSCKEMERETFADPTVLRALANTTTLQADVTDNDAVDQALLDHFGLIGPPTILFFGADGRERRNYRVMGFMGPEDFSRHVAQALR